MTHRTDDFATLEPIRSRTAFQCPACGRMMQFRDGLRCRHCKSVAVRHTEPFFRDPEQRDLPVYVWNGHRWRAV